MEIISGIVTYVKTDNKNNINLQNIDSIRILPEEDANDDKNIIEATMGGTTIQLTGYLDRVEAEEKLEQLIKAYWNKDK
jgi:beta-lactamase superfamily II metal-dependent hydrolase